MPEFPEVATVITYLRHQIVNKVINNIIIHHRKVWKGALAISELVAIISGKKIITVQQKGKHIIFCLTSGYLIAHLRMEGKFYFQPNGAQQPNIAKRHIGYVIQFQDESHLWFSDLRQFGTLHYAASGDELTQIVNIGFDPFDKRMTPQFIHNLARTSRRMIKPFLLDQKMIAGIGNIYADEVLFRCGIHPMSIASTLGVNDWQELLNQVKTIFRAAILMGGTTIFTFHNNFVDGKFKNNLTVYGRKGLPCIRCMKPIQKIKVSNRGTSFCSGCQKISSLSLCPTVYFLTGKICSGKTTLMKELQQCIGGETIYADEIINKLYQQKQQGWEIINSAYPSCIKTGKVDKQALFKIILRKPSVLKAIEQKLDTIFFQELEADLRRKIDKQMSGKQRPILVEIPFKDVFCEWLKKSEIFRARVIYLSISTEIQIPRLQHRNTITALKAHKICHFFNARESKTTCFRDVVINNNTNQIAKTVQEIINKIYLIKI